jgi:hypothetical protein
MNQLAAEITISPLTDAKEDILTAAAVLTWNGIVN